MPIKFPINTQGHILQQHLNFPGPLAYPPEPEPPLKKSQYSNRRNGPACERCHEGMDKCVKLPNGSCVLCSRAGMNCVPQQDPFNKGSLAAALGYPMEDQSVLGPSYQPLSSVLGIHGLTPPSPSFVSDSNATATAQCIQCHDTSIRLFSQLRPLREKHIELFNQIRIEPKLGLSIRMEFDRVGKRGKELQDLLKIYLECDAAGEFMQKKKKEEGEGKGEGKGCKNCWKFIPRKSCSLATLMGLPTYYFNNKIYHRPLAVPISLFNVHTPFVVDDTQHNSHQDKGINSVSKFERCERRHRAGFWKGDDEVGVQDDSE